MSPIVVFDCDLFIAHMLKVSICLELIFVKEKFLHIFYIIFHIFYLKLQGQFFQIYAPYTLLNFFPCNNKDKYHKNGNK